MGVTNDMINIDHTPLRAKLSAIEEKSSDDEQDTIFLDGENKASLHRKWASIDSPKAQYFPRYSLASLYRRDSTVSLTRRSIDSGSSANSTKRRIAAGTMAMGKRLSFRTTAWAIASFRKGVVIFDKADMCLCGLLSLSLSVHLISCVEVFFAMVLLMQAPDLITMDGTYFYFLGLMEGTGEYIFLLHLIMCVSCAVTAILLYAGGKSRKPNLLLPHFFWQITFIVLAVTLSAVLINLGLDGKMLLPSSIVLSSMLLIPAIAEVWWSYLTLCYFRQLRRKCSKKPTTVTLIHNFSESTMC